MCVKSGKVDGVWVLYVMIEFSRCLYLELRWMAFGSYLL
jgi:hypothetical protein